MPDFVNKIIFKREEIEGVFDDRCILRKIRDTNSLEKVEKGKKKKNIPNIIYIISLPKKP